MSDGIIVAQNSELFDISDLFYKEFPSDYRQVRFFGLLLIQKAPTSIRDVNLLEQQVTELLRNAIKHGNKLDKSKKIHVWYGYTDKSAHLIIEDEGDGFANLEEWNAFYKKRKEYLEAGDFEKLVEYASFRDLSSDFDDGGNALFAAVEYWNEGVVFNKKRNKVAVKRKFGNSIIGTG